MYFEVVRRKMGLVWFGVAYKGQFGSLFRHGWSIGLCGIIKSAPRLSPYIQRGKGRRSWNRYQMISKWGLEKNPLIFRINIIIRKISLSFGASMFKWILTCGIQTFETTSIKYDSAKCLVKEKYFVEVWSTLSLIMIMSSSTWYRFSLISSHLPNGQILDPEEWRCKYNLSQFERLLENVCLYI